MGQVGDALHVAVDLLGHRRLLLGSRRHLGVHVADPLDLLGDGAERGAGVLAGRDAGAGGRLPGLHGLHRGVGAALQPLDHLLDLAGRGLGAAGQAAHLVGDHREAAAQLAGPCRLDGGVEGEQVGLLGDAADHRQHLVDGRYLPGQLADRRRGLADLAGHGLDMGDRAADHLARLQRLVAGAVRGLRGAAGVARDLLHGEAHLVHRGGHQVGHLALPIGTPGGVLHHAGDLLDRRAQALAGGEHLADQAALAFQETVEAARQVAQLVGARGVQPAGQVAAATADFHQRRGDLAQRPHQAARQQGDQAEEQQRHAGADQAGEPQRAARFGIDLRLRHLADQQPVEAFQRLRDRQERLAVALEAQRLATAGQQPGRGLGAHQPAQRGDAAQRGIRMDLDRAPGVDQEHLAARAEAEVADHLRHRRQVVAEAGHAEGLAAPLDALVDEQRGSAGGLVDIDLQHPVAAAVDQSVEPLVLRLAALEGAHQALAGGVVAAGEGDDGGGQGLLLDAHALQVAGELVAPRRVFAVRQPVLHQAVLGDAGVGGDRRGEHPLEVVADRQHPRRQRLLDQVAVAQAVDHPGVDADDQEEADQQGGAHAEGELPLDAALPESHGRSCETRRARGRMRPGAPGWN
ncbi:hypothetical protein D9M68_433330 [compost metagenome]